MANNFLNSGAVLRLDGYWKEVNDMEGANGEVIEVARSIVALRRAMREERNTLKQEYQAKLEEVKQWYLDKKQEIRDGGAERVLNSFLGEEEEDEDAA